MTSDKFLMCVYIVFFTLGVCRRKIVQKKKRIFDMKFDCKQKLIKL